MNCKNINFHKQAHHKVSIECPIYIEDTLGGREINGWDLVAEAWAIIRQVDSKELAEHEQLENSNYFELIIHHLDTLDLEQRIIVDGRILSIHSISAYDSSLEQYGQHYQKVKAQEIISKS